MNELWIKIKNYENYEISTYGNIRHIKTKTNYGYYDKNIKYMRCKLTKNNITKCFLIHRLVAETFIDNSENKQEVNHINGNKTDNKVNNLEWVTRIENMKHSNSLTNFQIISAYKICPITKNIIKYEKFNDLLLEYPEFTYRKFSDLYFNKGIIYKNYIWKRDIEEEDNDLENEIWVNLSDSIYKEISIYKRYKVSNYGRIKGYFNRILKLNYCNGYATIKLVHNNKSKSFKVHRIIIMAFNIPNLEQKCTVDHIDKNITNNKLSNLRWATYKEQKN